MIIFYIVFSLNEIPLSFVFHLVMRDLHDICSCIFRHIFNGAGVCDYMAPGCSNISVFIPYVPVSSLQKHVQIQTNRCATYFWSSYASFREYHVEHPYIF